MSLTPYLSVIVPSFNEMVNLRKGVLDKIEHFLGKQKYTFEVIIVDDGSTDGSDSFVEEFVKEDGNFRLIKSSHLGKAGAVTKGMLEANGKYHLFTDMDQATPIEEVSKLLPYFEEKYDVIIGSRSNSRKGSPLTRIIMSRGMVILRKIMVGLRNIQDTQCGFKIFTAEASKKIFERLNQMHSGYKKISGSNVTAGFDVELLYLANKMGFKIKEVPVNWLYVETRRVSPIHDSINGLMDLATISVNKMIGKYSV